jgi:hypothetical protein
MVPTQTDRSPPTKLALLLARGYVYFLRNVTSGEVHLPAARVESTATAYEKLGTLLRKDLDFDSADSAYASHGIHPFAAKLPGQRLHIFIEELTEDRNLAPRRQVARQRKPHQHRPRTMRARNIA